MLQKGPPFQFLGYLKLIRNNLRPNGPPFGFFWYCETLLFFQLNGTAVLFSKLYHILFKLMFFSALCSFSETLIWPKSALPLS